VSDRVSEYLFAGCVRLRIQGPDRALRHFDAEYGEVASPQGAEPDVDVRIRFSTRLEAPTGGALVVGGHKTARWRVALGPPAARPLQASIALAGGPPSFSLSLVQGYFIEALISVALARAGRVALPSAGFAADGGGATVLLGRSGAGKTTLTARALAAGRTVLSDDQVVLNAAGCVWRYPRRLRFYPDIQQTAPEAWALLEEGTRAALLRRGRVRRLTRGWVAPSLAVPVYEIGATVERDALPLRRLVVVDRSDDAEDMTVTARRAAWVAEQAGLVLADQRARLSRDLGGVWAGALDAALATECRTVAQALDDLPATEIVIPRAWDARRSVDALDSYLGLTTGPATPPAERPPAPAR
jgi:hypothetical protein